MKKAGKSSARACFLGLDSSTQSIKATLIDADLNVIYEQAVNFDKELPEFKTTGGVHKHPDGLTVTSPPLMWVAAFEILLKKMKADKCPLGRIASVSGSGQQHGSVWLTKGARMVLNGIVSGRPLRNQLAGIFSVADSPIWMDSSTGAQCRALEKALGGAQSVANLTGSRAYERFTGNQIAKIYQNWPLEYAATERICLVSSFVASLLIGDYAPIDASDGSGMNLMDIFKKTWAPAALKHTAPGLDVKLGEIVPSHAILGKIHPYYCREFGFNNDCVIVAFSGDNPCSLAGLRLQHTGDIAISLGTSDTLFGSLSRPKPSASEGHIFVNPVEPKAYMAMVVRKNGSLTRERVRNESSIASWREFDEVLRKTPPGNNGNVGFYIDQPEITPPIMKTGTYRFNAHGRKVTRFPAGADIRAVVESQFLSLRLHGSNIGLKPASILATGGASVDEGNLKVIADVFGVPVFVGEQSNSAGIGAAYRAMHGWTCAKIGRLVPLANVLAGAPPFRKAMEPDHESHLVYTRMLKQYAMLEKKVVAGA